MFHKNRNSHQLHLVGFQIEDQLHTAKTELRKVQARVYSVRCKQLDKRAEIYIDRNPTSAEGSENSYRAINV